MTFRSSLKWLLALLIVFRVCFFPSFVRAGATEAKPVVEIPSPRHDAGAHWEGDIVTHGFEVKNNGRGELRILSVKPG